MHPATLRCWDVETRQGRQSPESQRETTAPGWLGGDRPRQREQPRSRAEICPGASDAPSVPSSSSIWKNVRKEAGTEEWIAITVVITVISMLTITPTMADAQR